MDRRYVNIHTVHDYTYLAFDRLMDVPEDISLDDIQSSCFSLFDEVRPHL